MREVWDRIEAWLSENVPEVLEGLNSGASDSDITLTEAFLGVTFPEDVRECYRRHDGQDEDMPGILPGSELFCLRKICDEWEVWNDFLNGGEFTGLTGEPSGPVQDDWWNPAWIPIAYDDTGNLDCLDFDPAEGGRVGQIIKCWHDGPGRIVIASSLTAWLEELAGGLESGEYLYDEEEYDGIVSKDDLV